MKEQVVFDTPWFQLVARQPPLWDSPHYSIRTQDYVCVIALTRSGQIILVKQYRPAVGTSCLEFPSGHVEKGEKPVAAAERELREETGYKVERLQFLGQLAPDVGRLANRMWCFFAANAVPVGTHDPEPGIDTIIYPGTLRQLLEEPDFNHALHHAALLLAMKKGLLALDTSHASPLRAGH